MVLQGTCGICRAGRSSWKIPRISFRNPQIPNQACVGNCPFLGVTGQSFPPTLGMFPSAQHRAQPCPEPPQHHPGLSLGQAESRAEAETPWICLWRCFPFILTLPSLHWEEAGSEKSSLDFPACLSSFSIMFSPLGGTWGLPSSWPHRGISRDAEQGGVVPD